MKWRQLEAQRNLRPGERLPIGRAYWPWLLITEVDINRLW